MVRLSSTASLVVLLGCGVAACRHTADVAPTPAPATGLSQTIAELRWVLHGSRLLVDNTWLMNPETGGFRALPYATSRPVEGGGTELLGVSLSREGTRVVVWDSREFRFGPVDSALSGPLPIPRLSPPFGAASEADAPRQAQLLFWNARGQLLLYQQALVAAALPACGVFDERTQTWQPVTGCPAGDFVELAQVDPGPEGWFAVTSEGEGAKGVRLTWFSPGEKPPGPEPVPFDAYPVNPIQAQFSRDGARLYLATPCRLEREQPCQDVEEDAPWRLYSWLLQERHLAMKPETFPPRFAPSPTGEAVAWPLPGRVCLDARPSTGSARCYALPAAP